MKAGYQRAEHPSQVVFEHLRADLEQDLKQEVQDIEEAQPSRVER